MKYTFRFHYTSYIQKWFYCNITESTWEKSCDCQSFMDYSVITIYKTNICVSCIRVYMMRMDVNTY